MSNKTCYIPIDSLFPFFLSRPAFVHGHQSIIPQTVWVSYRASFVDGNWDHRWRRLWCQTEVDEESSNFGFFFFEYYIFGKLLAVSTR